MITFLAWYGYFQFWYLFIMEVIFDVLIINEALVLYVFLYFFDSFFGGVLELFFKFYVFICVYIFGVQRFCLISFQIFSIQYCVQFKIGF